MVDYDAAGLEAMATRFCARPVSSLLLDAGETYHGQLSQDWALRGNRTASIYSVIQCAPSRSRSATLIALGAVRLHRCAVPHALDHACVELRVLVSCRSD